MAKKTTAQIKREVEQVLRGGGGGRRYEPGQRVDIVTSDGFALPGVHTVVDGSRWGLDESRFVRVRRVLHGERTTEDWPIGSVRSRR